MSLYDGERLDDFDADEWFEVCKEMAVLGGKPPLTRDAFDGQWAEFQDLKRRRAAH